MPEPADPARSPEQWQVIHLAWARLWVAQLRYQTASDRYARAHRGGPRMHRFDNYIDPVSASHWLGVAQAELAAAKLHWQGVTGEQLPR